MQMLNQYPSSKILMHVLELVPRQIRKTTKKTTLEKWPKNVWKRIPLLMQWHVKSRGKGSRKYITMLHKLYPEYKAFLGEKWKDGSEKGRELKERKLSLSPLPLPHLKSPLP